MGDPAHQRIARGYLSRTADQHIQHFELGPGQRDAVTVNGLQMPGRHVELELAEFVDPPGQATDVLGPPQQVLDPRQQLTPVERLTDIIIRTKLQPDNSVDLIVPAGYQNDPDL